MLMVLLVNVEKETGRNHDGKQQALQCTERTAEKEDCMCPLPAEHRAAAPGALELWVGLWWPRAQFAP